MGKMQSQFPVGSFFVEVVKTAKVTSVFDTLSEVDMQKSQQVSKLTQRCGMTKDRRLRVQQILASTM